MATLMQIYQCSKCLEQFHDVDLALTHDCPLLEAETNDPDPTTASPLASPPSPSNGKSTDAKESGEQQATAWTCFTHKWGEEATQLLISLYKERQHKFMYGKHKKKVLWTEISNGLVAKGHVFTPWQCEHRWKMLLKIYSKVVEQHKFGSGQTECSFFSELDEMYGPGAEVHPVATRSSLLMNRALMVHVVPSEQSDQQLTEEVSSSQPEVAPWSLTPFSVVVGDQGRTGTKRKVALKSGAPQWINALKKQRLDLELQKIEDARRMHEEEMGLLSELLDILKSRVEGKCADGPVLSKML